MNRLERELERRWEARCRRGICSLDLFDEPSAPAPDPAIGQAAASNAEIGKEALAFSKLQYEEAKPRQAALDDIVRQVLTSQIQTQDRSAAQAEDYYGYMKSTFRPVEQSLVQQAADFDTEARREELAAQGAADVEQAAAASDAAARRSAARYGINPADGAFTSNLAGNSLNKTIAKVGVMNNARTAARTEGRAFKFDVAGLGRGLPAAGTSASSVALQAGNAAVGNAAAPAANARADEATRLSGMGTAIAGNQSAGNLYSGLYDAQMRGYQSELAQQGAMAQGLGQLGGMALYKWSSKKLKHRHGKVNETSALNAIKKTPIGRWRYKKEAMPHDQQEHIGAYAEDFQKNFKVGDGKGIDMMDAMGATMAATKGLAKQVDRIERKVSTMARTQGRRGHARPFSIIAEKGVKHA
ncbi:MAG: tail fiber domain-containing protein [Betaproteobacteria bacterium]|nr:tail fiber domain-containing protein [Betaproteobacteria bacterium]